MTKTPAIGFVSVDGHGHWPGGRYFLHHLIRALALLPENERPSMRAVWWLRENESDRSFHEVRGLLKEDAIISPPTGFWPRVLRRARNGGRRATDLRDLFQEAGVDVLFPTSACEAPGIPMIYWLPDFQHRRLPNLHSAELFDWFEQNFRRKAEEADLVVLSSQDTLDDFLRFLPEYSEKARLLHCASLPQSEWFELDPVETARAKSLRDDFFLICNQFTAHKNHLAVFEAVRRLKQRGVEVQIACTGHATDYKQENYGARLAQFVSDHGLQRNIRLLGFLPRAEQMALFRGARAIVQPSLFEGWSTPVEDAKSLSRPIILSDIAIHREKLDGLIAALVAPEDIEGWADALQKWAEQPPVVTAEMTARAIADAKMRATASAKRFIALTREACARHEARA